MLNKKNRHKTDQTGINENLLYSAVVCTSAEYNRQRHIMNSYAVLSRLAHSDIFVFLCFTNSLCVCMYEGVCER